MPEIRDPALCEHRGRHFNAAPAAAQDMGKAGADAIEYRSKVVSITSSHIAYDMSSSKLND
jgi:hypothetical protein